MAHSSVIGLFAYCKGCSNKFELGSLNARALELPMKDGMEPYEMGWLCRCDSCGKEFTYRRIEFVP
jgi:hypothetical protein